MKFWVPFGVHLPLVLSPSPCLGMVGPGLGKVLLTAGPASPTLLCLPFCLCPSFGIKFEVGAEVSKLQLQNSRI